MKEHIPTDPLPEGWYWEASPYGAVSRVHVVRISGTGPRGYDDWSPAWAFMYEDGTWGVRSEGDRGDGSDIYTRDEATFPTVEEATHYISVRALLGTWPKKPE